MKLALYSGGNGQENKSLVRETLTLLEGLEDPLVTFIPSDTEDAAADFRRFRKKFSGTAIKRFHCQPIDRRMTLKEKKALFSSDAIFLGGGNTFYFLKFLRENRLLPRLKAYVKNGGVLMGLSAGSILMTPSIMTAAVPEVDRDENEVGLTNLNALGLVPFEFSPHYYRSKEVDAELLAYSMEVSHPIYACEDGQGIVVKNGRLRFVGKVRKFHRGRKLRVTH